MSPLALILIVLLILFALGGLPAFNFHTYGYRPTSIATIILVILIILLLLGRI